MQFWKYSATGNDFIMLDNREGLKLKWSELAPKWCHRRFGIGADGIILLENSKDADFRMRLINADGSEAEMCGNGARAIVHFAHHILKIKNDKKYTLQTMNSFYNAEVLFQLIKVEMSEVGEAQECESPDFAPYPLKTKINTGVPHCVLEVDNLENYPVYETGKTFRHHKEFPKGANINFIKIESSGLVSARTYERGVENETYSCGTGVTAIAASLRKMKKWRSPIKVMTKGGEVSVEFEDEKYFLFAPVFCIYQGEISI